MELGELIEHWTLLAGDLELVASKRGRRGGFRVGVLRTEREGNPPERTVYGITGGGAAEARWLPATDTG